MYSARSGGLFIVMESVGRAKNSPWRFGVAVLLGAAAALLGSAIVVSQTPWWFFQPWRGPIARQNVKVMCVMERGFAGDVVFLGDSRVRHDFVSGIVEDRLSRPGSRIEVGNLGLDAAQTVAAREIAGRIMSLDRPPRVAVLGLAAYSFNDNNPRFRRDLNFYAGPGLALEGFMTCPRWEQKKGALASLARGLETIFQLPAWKRARGQCLLARRSGGSAYLHPYLAGAREHNRRAVAYRTGAERERAYERELARVRDEMLADMELGGAGEKQFRQTVALLQDGGARVLVVLTPESTRFRSDTASPGRDRAERRIGEVCSELGLRVVDLKGPTYLPAEDDYFDYAAHLGPEAAMELSEKLADRELAGMLDR